MKNASHELVKWLSWGHVTGSRHLLQLPSPFLTPNSPREQLSAQHEFTSDPDSGMTWEPVNTWGSKGVLWLIVCCLLLKWKEVLRAVCVPSPGPSLLPLPALPGESCVVGRNPHPAWAQGPGHVDADLRFTQYCGKSAGKPRSSLA